MSDAKAAPDPKWVGGLIGAVVLALGGGMGSGYALRGTGANQESKAVDPARVAVLEALATRAQQERDQEREQWTAALKDSTATNAALRVAVVALTEKFGAMTERQDDLDDRVKALETRRR